MPIYEYQCTGCHHTFDALQKVSDEPIKICPACAGEFAVRLVSAAGFQLKGTGWYATDFKNKTPSTAPDASSAEKKVNSATESKTSAAASSTTASEGSSS